MDNARLLLAIALAIVVIIATNLLFPAPQRPAVEGGADSTAVAPSPAPAGTLSTAPGGTPGTGASPGTAAPPGSTAAATAAPSAPPAAGASTGAAQAPSFRPDTLVVSSPLYRYAFSTAGGALVSARLLQFESFTRAGPVELAPPGHALVSYALQIGESVVDLRSLPFQPQGDARLDLAGGSAPRHLRLVHADPSGVSITLDYTFRPDRYLVDVQGAVDGLGGGVAPTLLIHLGPAIAVNEADTAEDLRSLAYVVNGRRDGITSVPLRRLDAQRVEEGPLYWSALRDKYFLAAALAPCAAASADSGCFGGAIARPLPAAGDGGVDLAATLPLEDGRFSYSLYLGPQDYDRLAALGSDLQDVNPWGWQVFRPILRPLSHLIVWAVSTLHNVLRLGYGWVLILFGFLLQVILWPLYARATRSQLKNMELQPVIQEIQQKYKNDQEKLQKEMMRLYKEEGFNPLGGCLPMLIPYPVLITLFFVFRNTIEFRGAEFLWLPDLSRPDPLYILPILLAVSMFILQWLSVRSAPSANQQMKIMMWVMPAFIAFFFFKLPAGLNLYYAASNLASVPRQVQIMNERKRVQTKMKR